MEQLMITPEGYIEIKQKIKDKLNETTNNFIVIGYYLKQVRDSGAYLQDGYHNMEEFALGEYKLSASTASRFMDINTRFSQDGNSLQIKEEFCNYGYSKLQEMLTVKDSDMELITPDTTVTQIREIKKAEKAEAEEERQREAANLPIVKLAAEQGADEVTEEDKPVAISQECPYSPLEQTLIALWKEQPAEVISGIRGGMITGKDLAEILSPSGSKVFQCKTYMLFMYTHEMGVKFRYYADGKANVDPYTYDKIIEITNSFVNDDLFTEITSKVKAAEVPAEAEKKEPEQKEQTQPAIENKPVNEPQPVKTTDLEPPVQTPAQILPEDSYHPLPGQMTLEGANGQQETETVATSQEPDPAAGVQDAEYRELQNEEEYTQIEIDNAIGYFETEYNRMAGMGINSTKCRNYKMALDAIRKVYGHETEE